MRVTGALTPRDDVAALEVRRLSKSFGGVRALEDVHLAISPGEIHGLLGQNGSGKSTLIKILAGYHPPEPGGECMVHGERVSLPLAPGEFRELGLAFVHQDLALISSLSVVENLFATQIASGKWSRVSWRRQQRAARELFARYGLDLDPAAKVNEISEVNRALLAIVRAAEDVRASSARGLGVLILDEPTAFLPREDARKLFALVREVAAKGGSIVFVSHDIDEVLGVADRVTVLRDGRVVGTRATAHTTRGEVVGMIIGRQLEAWVEHDQQSIRRTLALSVASLSGGLVKDVDLDVHEGEILGIAGLRGSGYEDILYLIFGARPAREGRLTISGQTYDVADMTPARSMSAGVVLLPANRQTDGAILSLSVTDNVTMNVLDRFMERGLLRRKAMTHKTRALVTEFDVRPPDARKSFFSLSGGNQQKALLAKWLQIQPRIFLAHEPTLGVDVGARRQISILLKQATERGTAVICASSDYEELAAICDRVLILAQGKVISELAGAGVTKDRIAARCLTAGGNLDG